MFARKSYIHRQREETEKAEFKKVNEYLDQVLEENDGHVEAAVLSIIDDVYDGMMLTGCL